MATISTKYPRTYHFSHSPGTTSDDRIARDNSSVENTPIVIMEKLDGQNSGISKVGVYARSHGTPTQHEWDKAIWDIWRCIKKDLDDDTFIFGENMYAEHSIRYTNLESYYYVFGVRIKDEWLSWDDVKEWAYLLSLPTVPVFFEGVTDNIHKTVNGLLSSPSLLGGFDPIANKPCIEGVVCRKTCSFDTVDFPTSVYKYVRANHVQTNEHWTKSWKRQPLKFESMI